ncbi:uncharacterized protein MKK02DRAFT_30608 [Dioszegia hungarica]|uniref:DUF2470 domain-containing protein n=1 Tax=Dioszegia hungarica TaxID=4972 RepID=A0AA38H1J8_9TREE|nr:uncharacterized protein MKK02DRAFT_30608 [Dioszegia hungarica]KAI9632882.1 hypothetical protein MKK02DRAFT_30608 [Dioszegia hungarica]
MAGLIAKGPKGQQDAENMLSYMNNQPDMLTAILKHRTDFKGHPGDLYILPIPKTLDKIIIQAQPPRSRKPVEVEIKFDPPMEDLTDFRPRILAWRDEAFKHYKIQGKPKIGYYSEPDLFPFTLPIIVGLAALGFALYGKGDYADKFRFWINNFFGPGMLPAAKWLVIVSHSVETVYMAWAMTQHSVPLFSSILWVFSTALLGWATISEFWESIQYERLRHILRQTDVGDIPPRVGGSAQARTAVTSASAGSGPKPVKGKKKAQ